MDGNLMPIACRSMRLIALAAVLLANVISGPVSAGSAAPGSTLKYSSLTCVGYKPTFGHGSSYDGANSARIRAKRHWRAKVKSRYGAAFANLSKARSRSITCHSSGYHRQLTQCNVSAYPCAERTLSNPAR